MLDTTQGGLFEYAHSLLSGNTEEQRKRARGGHGPSSRPETDSDTEDTLEQQVLRVLECNLARIIAKVAPELVDIFAPLIRQEVGKAVAPLQQAVAEHREEVGELGVSGLRRSMTFRLWLAASRRRMWP